MELRAYALRAPSTVRWSIAVPVGRDQRACAWEKPISSKHVKVGLLLFPRASTSPDRRPMPSSCMIWRVRAPSDDADDVPLAR